MGRSLFRVWSRPLHELASVKFADGNRIVGLVTAVSSVESAKTYVMQMVESVFALAGADVAHSDGYPGWPRSAASRLLEVTVDAYKRLSFTELKVRATTDWSAGCSFEKYPDGDGFNRAPRVHSPTTVEIATVPKFWDLLL